jgi:hypothetical protein
MLKELLEEKREIAERELLILRALRKHYELTSKKNTFRTSPRALEVYKTIGDELEISIYTNFCEWKRHILNTLVKYDLIRIIRHGESRSWAGLKPKT